MNLSLSEYKAIVEFSPNMIWRAGIDAKCNYFNETWLRFTGKKMEEEVGDGWVKGVHPDNLDFCFNTYLEAFNKQEAFEMEYRLIRHDGEWRWINDRGVPFYDENGEFAGYIGSCMDVTDKIEGKNLTEMAHNDQLTGLINRNFIEHLLEREFRKALEKQSDPVVIMMMDVDHFKSFNDQYGHNFGDKVLKNVACQIVKNVRETDIVCRYGGDEFLVLLQRISLKQAQHIADKIMDGIRRIDIEKVAIKMSVSIGIVNQSDESKVSEVVEKADQAMYRAKQAGGNQYKLFED